MAKAPDQAVDNSYQYQKIAAERALWVVKPVAIVVMIVWCLHPGTTKEKVLERNTLGGFLAGAFYGVFVNRQVLQYFLVTRRKSRRSFRNEMPDDYYFGKIIDVLDGEKI